MLVKYARKLLLKAAISKSTCQFTPARNHILDTCAKKKKKNIYHRLAVSRTVRESILVTNNGIKSSSEDTHSDPNWR